MRKRQPTGFTLVELLAVIAIMAIVLLAAVPMFQAMGKRDLGSAASQLRATLRLARQHAVVRRQNVYVVFPDNRDSVGSEDVDKILRSYAVLAETGTSSYVYLTDWKYLPQGVYLDDSVTLTGSIFRLVHVDPSDFPFPTETSMKRTMPVIGFSYDGCTYGVLPGSSTWVKKDMNVYLTTSRIYNRNASGTRLVAAGHIPGETNAVRARKRTGQVDIRWD